MTPDLQGICEWSKEIHVGNKTRECTADWDCVHKRTFPNMVLCNLSLYRKLEQQLGASRYEQENR